jgi:hypothetical protein
VATSDRFLSVLVHNSVIQFYQPMLLQLFY